MDKGKVLIIGGGLAGLSAARHLGRDHRVRLVSASPWCEWQPNIHELVSGAKTPESLRLPLEPILRRLGHEFINDRVVTLQPEEGRAELASGQWLDFDACIVAVGGVDNHANVRGVGEHALPFKSVEHCYRIHEEIKGRIAEGGRHSIAIVGGGLEGVECLGEILRGFGRHRSSLEIHMVDGAKRLLADAPARVDRSIRQACRSYPVKFHLGKRVTSVAADHLTLAGGRTIPADITIWTGGVCPHPLLHESGLADEGEWAPVSGTLLSRRFENVLVAGDAADPGENLTKQAYHAMAMGEQAGINAAHLLAGERLHPFKPAPKPRLVTFGNLDCFLIFDRMVVAGMVLAQIKEAVYQVNMARLNPPSRPGPALAFYQRLYNSFWHSLWPNVTSLSRLTRLPQLRVFQSREGHRERA